MYRTALFLVAIILLPAPVVCSSADGQADQPRGHLPTSFDAPFTPQHIDPDIATISLSPGFDGGRYDIRISLSETTLYDRDHERTRNYEGEFVLQSIALPTDEFVALEGRSYENVMADGAGAWIEFRQTPASGEEIQAPFAQHYPVQIESIRFGPARNHVIYVEIEFYVDFAAIGPPHPWSRRQDIDPYRLALSGLNRSPGYSEKEWEAFRDLVEETEETWKEARYSTNVRVLLNHRYQSSTGMNTHER